MDLTFNDCFLKMPFSSLEKWVYIMYEFMSLVWKSDEQLQIQDPHHEITLACAVFLSRSKLYVQDQQGLAGVQ